MNPWWWLVLGLLAGWLIELVIDYRYWRRHAQIAAARVAQQEAAVAARSEALDKRQAEVEQRDADLSALQTSLNAKDAELLAQARRVDERATEVSRLEQAMDKRRADLDRMGLTLNEREKDINGRDAALKSNEADVAARTQALKAAETDMTRRVAAVSNRESAIQSWEERILAREHEVGDQESELVRKAATADRLEASLTAIKHLVHRQYQTEDGNDDLQAVEGIGPKIASLLRNADIRTFERLSETSLGELTRLLESGGSRFGLADPLTWAEQASLLVSGEYVEFEQLKEELVRGVRRDAVLLAPDSQGSAGTAGASDGTLFEAAATTSDEGNDVKKHEAQIAGSAAGRNSDSRSESDSESRNPKPE